MVYLSKHTKNLIFSILIIISQIESGGDSSKIGDSGKAFGHLQIHKECVEDVNRWYGTKYKHEDMFIRKNAEDVFFKYIALGEDFFIKKNLSFPTEKDIVNFWNWGIYQTPSNDIYWNEYILQKELSLE